MQPGFALGNVVRFIGVQSEEDSFVAELKAGSEEAFAWLIAKYHQPIFSLVLHVIPDAADAADLTQDVFIKIYRNIGGFSGRASLRTWIYRIALREASNGRRWWRRHKSREITMEAPTFVSADGAETALKDTLVDLHASPYDHAAQEELRSRVREALGRVPEPFRSVVVLRDIEGFSYDEIAEFLEVNAGTVKSRLMRGRARLKSNLAEFTAAAKRPSHAFASSVPALSRVSGTRVSGIRMPGTGDLR